MKFHETFRRTDADSAPDIEQHTKAPPPDGAPQQLPVPRKSRRKRKSLPCHTATLPSRDSKLPSDFELTDEFASSFSAMEAGREPFFITGRAGTGKSTLLHYFKATTGKNIVVVAPTGVAAINVGGATIHSFFRFPHRVVTQNEVRPLRERASLFKRIDTLVIDEASMVRADVMDGIDLSLRLNRDRPGEPFGGVQVILVGDLHQLPPVVEKDAAEYFGTLYESPFFFSARVFRQTSLRVIELRRVFRQRDPGFIALLDKIRTATLDREDLERLNQRSLARAGELPRAPYITLTTTNALANQINLAFMGQLRTEEYTYEASIGGNFGEELYPTERTLTLKRGAVVMMIRNDPDKRWVNGTVGVIHSIAQDEIQVRVNGADLPVKRVVWEKIAYEFDPESNSIEPVVAGTFTQYPIKLAWAITIHKSQGKTFDRVKIDFGNGAFAHGQAYVALSRCRSFEEIFLVREMRPRDIIVDARVRMFGGWDEYF